MAKAEEYSTLRETLKGLDKKTLCYLISDMMFDILIDERYITQIVAIVLKWADDNPIKELRKEEKL